MAYKAPLLMRLFHYALWTVMLFIVAWFFLIPTFLRVTVPEPTMTPRTAPDISSTGNNALMPVQEPAASAMAP